MSANTVIRCPIVVGVLLALAGSMQAGEQPVRHVSGDTPTLICQVASSQDTSIKSRPTALRTEIRQLREEVADLRRDVQLLTRLLEAQSPISSKNSKEREGRRIASENTSHVVQRPEDADKQNAPPSDEDMLQATRILTLEDAIIDGLANSSVLQLHAQQMAMATGDIIVSPKDVTVTNIDAQVTSLISSIEDAYVELWAAHDQFQTMRQARDAALDLWRQVVCKAGSSESMREEETAARKQYFDFRAEWEQSWQTMQTKERQLRSVLGWVANGGEIIIPAGLPDRLASHEEWDETLGVALSHSHTIQEQAAVVRQCELQLLSRKLEESGLIEDGDRTRRAELRNEQLRVARERARLEDLKLDSANRLTQALQQCDVARSELQTYRNRHTAADKCLRALGELADLGKRSNVTELLDVQRRWVASREDYCTAIAGLFAATRVVHVQKGTLLGYHRIMVPTVH